MARARVRFLLRARPRHDIAGLAQDHRAGRADPRRARLRRRPRRHHRDRRSGCARRGAARDRRAAAGAAAGELPAGRRQARRDAACAARTAARRARAGRCRARCRRARRSARSRSTSRAARSASPACRPARPARCRRRSERPMLRFAEDACVQCGLCKATCPEKVITLHAAARLPRRHRRRARAQGGGAVLLHPLRQAVRRQEHDRARRRQARRQALDVQGLGAAASTSSRCARTAASPSMTEEDFDPYGAPRAAGAHHRGLSARARGRRREGDAELSYFVAFSRNFTSASRSSAEPMRLLRHLGAGRVGRRADLEQLGHRLRRPDDVELLQRRRKIVAGQRRDPAAENAVQASGRRGCLRRASACGRRRRRGTPARRGRRHRPRADRRRRPSPPAPIGSPVDGVPAADHAVGAAGEQRAVVGKERRRPHRQAGPDQRAQRACASLRSMIATEPRMPAAATSAPSPDTATAMIGVWPLSISPRCSPSRREEEHPAVGAAGDDLAVAARPRPN